MLSLSVFDGVVVGGGQREEKLAPSTSYAV